MTKMYRISKGKLCSANNRCSLVNFTSNIDDKESHVLSCCFFEIPVTYAVVIGFVNNHGLNLVCEMTQDNVRLKSLL